MGKSLAIFVAALAVATLLVAPAAAGEDKVKSVDDLVLLTEQYPPYNFEGEDKFPTGISIDLFEKMLAKVGSKRTRKDMVILPWARSYARVQKEHNVCLFIMTRSAQREDLFKWVGPIAPGSVTLIAKKSHNIKLDSAADANRYRVVAVRDDIGEQLAVSAGVKLDNIERLSSAASGVRMLARNRADLMAYNTSVAFFTMKQLGMDRDDYETVYTLQESEVYYAFNKGVPDDVVQELSEALEELNKPGPDGTSASSERQQCIDRYLK